MSRLFKEYKNKPAMVTTKLYLMSKRSQKRLLHVGDVRLQELELLSESHNEDGTEFDDTNNLAVSTNCISIRSNITILKHFYSMCTQNQLSDEELHNIWTSTSEDSSSKGLIVRSYCSLLLGLTEEAYASLAKAFDDDKHQRTKSILSSLKEDQVCLLRDGIVEGRKSGELSCTCNQVIEKGQQNFGY